MFGRDLLLAPVLQEAERVREVYLPKGEWFDFWTGRRYDGGSNARIPVTLESIPIFVRGGAFVFSQPVVQHTGEMAGKPLEVQVFPAATSEAVIYEDDGETMAYAQGAAMRRRFSQSRTATTTTIDVAAPEGIVPPVRARSGRLGPRTHRRQNRDERLDRDDALHAAGTDDARVRLGSVGHRVRRRQAAR